MLNDIHPKQTGCWGSSTQLASLVKNYGRENMKPADLSTGVIKLTGIKFESNLTMLAKGLMVAEKLRAHFMDPVHPTPNDTLTEFSIQDAEGNWHWAKAKIDGDSVVVTSDAVSEPKNVFDSLTIPTPRLTFTIATVFPRQFSQPQTDSRLL